MSTCLITDSTSYLPEYQLKKHNINVISLSVNFEDDSFVELPENFDPFYDKLKKENYIPKSSQPAVSEMYDLFESAIKRNEEIIATFLSSKMSGTYSTACMIKEQLLEEYPDARITIIDSLSNCMQLGLCVIAGANAIAEGKNYEETVSAIKDTINKTKFVFTPSTLEYLRRGGRIGNAQALIGQLLQVKPILTVSEGVTTQLDKVRTRKKALSYMTSTFTKDIETFGLSKIVIHHIDAFDEAQKLKTMIQDQFDLDQIDIIPIGPVIGTHVGPGAIGIVYETKESIK